MNLSDRVLARRYAMAFCLSAAGKGAAGGEAEEKAVGELLRAAHSLQDEMPSLKDPRVSPAEKKALIKRALPDASARTLRFLDLLIDKKRFGLLPHVTGDLGRILDERKGTVRASARSAHDLAPAEAEALRARLAAFSGKSVVLDFKTDPELLAGAVVRMGDWVLDGSLAGQLRRLGESLMK
ncbi:MAG: ATP synthase F1 subunit delta [Elusimicrobiota bacterium]